MSGQIIGIYGYQRSGKTLLSYLIAKRYNNMGIPVYTNIDAKSFEKIEYLTDIPMNNEPKVLLLDEIYSYMDSRKIKDNADSTLFFNTIGKQNILMLFTSISPDMIEIRIRRQQNFMIYCRGNEKQIDYKIIDNVTGKSSCRTLLKSPELFNSLEYDTRQIPDIVDCDMKRYAMAVKQYNAKQKGKTNNFDINNIINESRKTINI